MPIAPLTMLLLLLAARVGAAAADGEAQFRELYKELVETNTSLSAGSCTLAAERLATRLRAAGFPDLICIFSARRITQRKAAWSPFIPAAIQSSKPFCCWRTWTWSRPSARTGRATRSSS